ncbi:MAG: hypothetical protein ACPHID_05030 [Thermoplasmatota archaeon]
MFRDAVAEHYRSKGYRLHQNVKVRGRSGAVHACDMIAQGPLGNLVISFGDDMPFEAAEMGAVRRTARDVGATPVVAVAQMPEGIRRLAARAGVVLLDQDALEAVELEPVAQVEEEAPMAWPDPERKRTEAPRVTEPAPIARTEPFAWLPKKPAPVEEPTRPAGVVQVHVPTKQAQEADNLVRWLLVAVVGGAAAGLVFFGLQSAF